MSVSNHTLYESIYSTNSMIPNHDMKETVGDNQNKNHTTPCKKGGGEEECFL